MRLSITSITAVNGGAEINVCFLIESDGGEKTQREVLTVSSKQYLVLGLAKGACDADVYDETYRASQIWNATKRGMSLLGFGACSGKALCLKLVNKGFSKEIAVEAVKELTAMGLIDENRDAAREAQKNADKLWGRRRITSSLYEKGYSSDAVDYALCALEDLEVDFVENCRTLIKKRFAPLPENKIQKQKIVSSLVRYGYSLSEIKEALS